jgi:hypothetical protein
MKKVITTIMVVLMLVVSANGNWVAYSEHVTGSPSIVMDVGDSEDVSVNGDTIGYLQVNAQVECTNGSPASDELSGTVTQTVEDGYYWDDPSQSPVSTFRFRMDDTSVVRCGPDGYTVWGFANDGEGVGMGVVELEIEYDGTTYFQLEAEAAGWFDDDDAEVTFVTPSSDGGSYNITKDDKTENGDPFPTYISTYWAEFDPDEYSPYGWKEVTVPAGAGEVYVTRTITVTFETWIGNADALFSGHTSSGGIGNCDMSKEIDEWD